MRPLIEAPGKAMIVGGTREICARLYAEIVALRPGLALRRARQGADQGRVLRQRHRPPSSISQARATRVGERGDQGAAAGGRRRAGDRHRQGHDAHRLRLAAAAHAVPGPAAQGRAAHADPGPGQPDLPRQERRAAGRLRAAGRQPAEGAGRVHARATRTTKPLGRSVDEAVALVRAAARARSRAVLGGFDWQSRADPGAPKSLDRTRSTGDGRYLRSPAHPRQPGRRRRGAAGARFRRLSRPAGPGLGAVHRHRELAPGPLRRAVLRRGPGLHGEVRRRRTAVAAASRFPRRSSDCWPR